MRRMRRIFFSVGEPSGDLHGANLIRSLQQKASEPWEAVGFGGPRMIAAGCEPLEDLTQFAVMWFSQVIKNLGMFRAMLRQADAYFAEHRPDAVVLIDFPGFNWWIARKAKKHQIPVFYYGVPQMWAWAPWRVRKMRRLVDHVLCKLPFEADWYNQRQCQATYVGHPYFDELEQQRPDPAFGEQLQQDPRPLVAILPGSRSQEVTNNLPVFLETACRIQRQVGNVRFGIASFNPKQAEWAREAIKDYPQLDIQVHVGRTAELIRGATCCLACSGSVSLELLYAAKPSVIHYRVGRLHYALGRLLVRVKYITLVNLLACEDRFDTRAPYDRHAAGAELVPFPEYPTSVNRSEVMAEHLCQWLTDPGCLDQKIAHLTELRNGLVQSGASDTAARYILQHLPSSLSTSPSPASAHPPHAA